MKLLLFLLVISSRILFAQNISDLPANSFPFNLSGQSIMQFDDSHDGILGYRTFTQDFNIGSVRFTDGTTYNQVPINYDALEDNLITYYGKIKSSVILRKDLIRDFYFLIDGDTLFFERHSIEGASQFLIPFAIGNTIIYCGPRKILRRAERGQAYSTAENTQDSFIDSYVYYYKKNGVFLKINFTKNWVTEIFARHKDEIKRYWRENKVNVNNIKSVATLVVFINQKEN
jgi:hypothetical protein